MAKHNFIITAFLLSLCINLTLQQYINTCSNLGSTSPVSAIQCTSYRMNTGVCCYFDITYIGAKGSACLAIASVDQASVNASKFELEKLGATGSIDCGKYGAAVINGVNSNSNSKLSFPSTCGKNINSSPQISTDCTSDKKDLEQCCFIQFSSQQIQLNSCITISPSNHQSFDEAKQKSITYGMTLDVVCNSEYLHFSILSLFILFIFGSIF
jgi:hypothetical protein